ncbi:hypothetical protein DMB66_10165 [Actinoplanes sp. ATCC 53533]|uniref:DoxX family protein n=1 Tax=Actinoplanes sp. ATCC 53533 TaxID=1288362 RepID=UPI000F7A7553|nr:hypothetical protein [Actinoplanes sp. ATCC 53533]RSM69883.1 hypothetical protein DMB66_10165 [Actinoplanes sp. ATCC 53533]
MTNPSKGALSLAGLLAASGVLHFVAPKPYDAIVPRSLPGAPRTWTLLSGAAELAVAAAVANPGTRRLGGLAAAGLFAAVFPANVQMAADWRHASPTRRAIAYGRLPLQIPLVLWGLHVARRPRRG